MLQCCLASIEKENHASAARFSEKDVVMSGR
jgi:hypothetical protein